MRMLWVKLFADLFRSPGRTLLAVFSIAAGVFAVGAIFGMVDQLLTGMDAAHRAVNPSHVNIILAQPVPEDVLDDLREIDGIVEIDPANLISVSYQVDNGKWQTGTIVSRPDYDAQAFDRIELKDGQWPGGGKIAVERLSSAYYNAGLGDSVTFRIDGVDYEREISGLVRHPFVQPPLFGGQANFFFEPEDLEALFGIPQGYHGHLYVQVAPYSLEFTQDVAGEIRARLADQGFGVLVSLYQEPDLHWGRMFVEGVTLVLQIMAVVSLFMSAVLVLNTFTALITQETNQIGMIKAVGGRRWHILSLYLTSALIYGLAALLIALPPSLAFAFYMSRWFLNLFNIDYDVFQFSQRALIFQALAALAAPLLAALFPVLKGAWISVREAIATYGLGGDFGYAPFDRLVERLGARMLPTMYAAALGNIFRRKARLVLSSLVLTAAGVMFLVIMALVSSTNRTLDNEMARQGYDLRAGFVRPQSIREVTALTENIRGVEQVEVWTSRNVTILRAGDRLKDSAGLGAQLTGLPPDTSMYQPIIATGRWLFPADDRALVISQETALKNGIAPGDTITLDLGEAGDSAWEVVGTYRVIYSSGFVVEPIYAPLDAVQEAIGVSDLGSQLLVSGRVSTLEQETALADRVKARLEESGITVDFYTTTARLDQRVYADNQFNSVISMLLSLAMLVASVGGLGLAGSLGISVVERTREIGVLRSIGGRTPAILGMFIMEGVLQGLLSFIIAVPISFILAQPLARQLGRTMIEVDLDFAYNYPAMIIWFVTVVIISILASIAPARRATRISVRESLAYT
jgi:putative ABC transport system permease protein